MTRKLNFSIEDIVSCAHSKKYKISYGYIYNLLKGEGFTRLPRRSATEKKKLEFPPVKAPVARKLKIEIENLWQI